MQRWLKFVKYLPQFGWQPYVFTPENPSFAIRDESLLRDVPEDAEILRFPIWEPYDAFGKISKLFTRKKAVNTPNLVAGNKGSRFQNFATWIRGNFFIPDPRIFWVRPSVRFLDSFIRDNKIKTIITTGPPHSLHLIGLRLKEINPDVKWIADFRDPWSEWGLLDSLKVGSAARRSHQRLETKVLAKADEIVTITPFYVRRFEALSKRPVTLLTNGFDEDDFKEVVHVRTPKFVLRHVGIVNEKCNPRPFLEAVMQLMGENSDFAKNLEIEFIGELHPEFQSYIDSHASLKAITLRRGNIPHKELLKIYGSSSALLLILTGYKDAEGYMPGKLFEYLATGIPVIGTGPEDGDAAKLLNETRAGKLIDHNQPEKIKNALRELFNSWQTGNSGVVNNSAIQNYSRKEVTRKLTELLV